MRYPHYENSLSSIPANRRVSTRAVDPSQDDGPKSTEYWRENSYHSPIEKWLILFGLALWSLPILQDAATQGIKYGLNMAGVTVGQPGADLKASPLANQTPQAQEPSSREAILKAKEEALQKQEIFLQQKQDWLQQKQEIFLQQKQDWLQQKEEYLQTRENTQDFLRGQQEPLDGYQELHRRQQQQLIRQKLLRAPPEILTPQQVPSPTKEGTMAWLKKHALPVGRVATLGFEAELIVDPSPTKEGTMAWLKKRALTVGRVATLGFEAELNVDPFNNTNNWKVGWCFPNTGPSISVFLHSSGAGPRPRPRPIVVIIPLEPQGPLVAQGIPVPPMMQGHVQIPQNPQPPVQNPQAPVQNPQAPVQNPQAPVQNPQGPVQNPQGPIPGAPNRGSPALSETAQLSVNNYLASTEAGGSNSSTEAGGSSPPSEVHQRRGSGDATQMSTQIPLAYHNAETRYMQSLPFRKAVCILGRERWKLAPEDLSSDALAQLRGNDFYRELIMTEDAILRNLETNNPEQAELWLETRVQEYDLLVQNQVADTEITQRGDRRNSVGPSGFASSRRV